MEKKPKTEQNQGEGNRAAAAEHNREQQRFVRSGKVGEKARAAAKAIEGKEREALNDAAAVGRRHAAEEDPQVKR